MTGGPPFGRTISALFGRSRRVYPDRFRVISLPPTRPVLAMSRLVFVLALGVLACPVVSHAQASCELGQGLVLLDTSPPADSVHVFNFLRSVAPEDTAETGLPAFVGVPTDRTLLVYGQPAFYFTAPGVDAPPPNPFYLWGGGVHATFSDAPWFFAFSIWHHWQAVGLRWVGEAGRWVQAVTNDSTGEAMWVRRGRHVATYTWADFFAAGAHVERRVEYLDGDVGRPYVQPLRTAPDDAAPEVPANGDEGATVDCFAVEEVRGEWFRVRAEECGSGRETPSGGWIRWCRRGVLLAWPRLEQGPGALIDSGWGE